jgi:hypothetical protein
MAFYNSDTSKSRLQTQFTGDATNHHYDDSAVISVSFTTASDIDEAIERVTQHNKKNKNCIVFTKEMIYKKVEI